MSAFALRVLSIDIAPLPARTVDAFDARGLTPCRKSVSRARTNPVRISEI